MANTQFISATNIVVRFPVNKQWTRTWIRPVNGVSFSLERGKVLSLVGESGSGKTTIGKTLVRILTPYSGDIRFQGENVTNIRGTRLIRYRDHVQMIFQDPFASLNPMRTVEQHLLFPVRRKTGQRGSLLMDHINHLLETVGLIPAVDIRKKYPYELSGGQRQRVAIARALATQPEFLVADEPVSMLDVSIRAGILELLKKLRDQQQLAFLYITHDLASARYIGDQIMVMYGGKVVEKASAKELVFHPVHPYTHLLLEATPGSAFKGPLPETQMAAPDLSEQRRGCVFAPRCPYVMGTCREEEPNLQEVSPQHWAACHLVNTGA
ncbi:peptide/nickel transport system ATP-binding protein [Sulfobacillus thermosulfidooxidans DSM 9293]|uniref:Peptide/nickel transport system ATP-binding protein n=1 Tax=Sulfobacillus thermosulfidooxidans (strain DSM 9293 / VKM B-1269 / AT-1) TaxID=929705 RepID=A0A1W1WEZ0_SULTA|nr:ABC transporter ATP-binding protein [Sulfobacillus thermosulfidooxidans]SMC04836.1 peptide/nickel transport system ATP-binding protein [Sulfobacillus thermosulfidooxidans DSM 9293]